MNVVGGDIFFNVGVAEKTKIEEVYPTDRRYDLIYLKVTQKNKCLGLIDMSASFSEKNVSF